MKNKSKCIGLLLSSSGFIVLNKSLIREIGLDATAIIGELCSEYNYYSENNQLTDKEWFYSTTPNIEQNTGLKRKPIDRCIKLLCENQIIETKIMGMPSKRYIKINFENIEKVIKNGMKSPKIKGCPKGTTKDALSKGCPKKTIKDVQKGQPCKTKKDNLASPKGTTKKNNKNNNKKNNITNLILSREEKMRNDTKYEDFKKKVNIEEIIDKYKYNEKRTIDDILSIIKDLYKIKDNEYITISGQKVYGNTIKEVLNNYNKDTIEYILESMKETKSKIKNIKAYLIATIYNAPKTINIYYQKKEKEQNYKIYDKNEISLEMYKKEGELKYV